MAKVILVQHGNEEVCGKAAKVCASSLGVEEVFINIESDDALATLGRAFRAGHESVIEHMYFTFAISEISRACSHQLVRHRIASYSQQSQRLTAIDTDKALPILPPSIEANDHAATIYALSISRTLVDYNRLIDLGIPAEDARYLYPNAAPTQLVMTLNARTLLHFFHERCCTTAQWEIRALAYEMLKLVKPVTPTIFNDNIAGPKCLLYGECREPKKRWEQCKKAPHWSDTLRLSRSAALKRFKNMMAQAAEFGLQDDELDNFHYTCDRCPKASTCTMSFDYECADGFCLASGDQK